jgi:hypothetical protein
MHNFKKSFVSFLGLLAMIVAVAALTPYKGYSQDSPESPAAVQDVRVVNTTALPVPTRIINAPNAPAHTRDVDTPKGNNIVTLYANSGTGYDFRRVFGNGARAATEFVVPANQVLIVTDVVWELTGANSGNGTTIDIAVRGASGAAHIVHVSHLTGDASFGVTSTESMKTGFAAAPGAKIILGLAGIGPSDVILHGYLVPAS